jgi:cytochrome c biogenesis protein CcmG/thiol:disulfide interchange protein DsbE
MVLAIAGGEEITTVKRFIAQHPHSYSNLFDAKQTVASSLQIQAIPHTVVISTDGVVRWQGNPLSQNFEQVVQQVVAADPYLKAKREGGGSATKQGAAESSAAEKAYASQNWPATNTGNLYATDVQGQTFGKPFAGVEWLDGDAADTENKVTIVDFWATWCGPCIAFSPKLDAVAKRFKDELVAVGVSGQGEDKDTVLGHIEEHPVSYRHAFAQGQELYKKVGISGIPHVLILSSDGVVRWQGFPGAVENFEGLVARIVMADRKARKAMGED